MRKLALIGATVVGAVVLSASPVSVKWSAERNVSVSQNKAFAIVGRPGHASKCCGCRSENRATGNSAWVLGSSCFPRNSKAAQVRPFCFSVAPNPPPPRESEAQGSDGLAASSQKKNHYRSRPNPD